MRQSTRNGAWIEWQGGGPVVLKQSCSIGRAPINQVVLPSDDVSRRHAVITEEGPHEFHVLDLGSSNGTFLNGRRVTRSTPLRDGDALTIGPFQILFRQRSPGPPETPRTNPGQTVQVIKGAEYWLVLADLADSTALSHRLKPEELPAVTGAWFQRCRAVIERHGGAIDNCLGDGFLAYWHSDPAAPDQVAAALSELTAMRDGRELPFRLAVHYGDVFVGGSMASGVERFFGPQINFAFKLERLASTLGQRGLLSATAHARLEGKLPTTCVGAHEFPGFPGTFTLYQF